MGTVIFTMLLILCLSIRPITPGIVLATHAKKSHYKISPCEDFYQFVCDEWMKTSVPHGVANWSKLEEETASVKHEVAKYLGNPVRNKDIHPVKWAKIHFQACMDENALDQSGVRPLANIVDDVNDFGWNILGDSPENDWIAVHNNYCRLTGSGALFTVEIGPDEDFLRNVLIINPTKELHLRHISKSGPEDTDRYEQFLTDIWTAYAKDRRYPIYPPNAVKNAIRDVLNFRQAIIEKRHLIQRTSTMDMMTLSNLQKHTSNNMKNKDLDWPRFLRSIFHIKFNELSVVHIRQFNYLKIILRAIESTTVKVLLNHIHLHFLERFIQHTSPHMNALFYHVLELPVPKRSITCISSNVMKKIVNYIYVRKLIIQHNIVTVLNVVRKVRRILKKQITKTRWTVKEAMDSMRKLDKMNMVIGYDSWYANKTNLVDYYSRMTISNNYLNNILDFETMSYRDALSKLGTPVTEEFNEPPTDPLDLSATYNYRTNTIVIPAALFPCQIIEQFHMLDSRYGGLGTTAGYVMSRSLDSLGRQYDVRGKRGNWWSNDTLNAYNKRLQCYSKRFKEAIYRAKSNLTEEERLNYQEVNINDYSDEIVAEYMGLVAAFETYQTELSAAETLPRYSYVNERKEFFVAYARRHCETFAAPVWAQIVADGYLPRRLRVNTALSNMQAFADTFHCEKNDPMNSSPKCEWLDESLIRNEE